MNCDGLLCRHHPLEEVRHDGPPILAGHLHPATRLAGPGHDRLRLPCYVLRGRQAILPAFGEFTGSAFMQADCETALCIIAGERLLHVPSRGPDPVSGGRRSRPVGGSRQPYAGLT